MSLTDRCVWMVSSCSRHQSSSPSVLAASLSNSSSDTCNQHAQALQHSETGSLHKQRHLLSPTDHNNVTTINIANCFIQVRCSHWLKQKKLETNYSQSNNATLAVMRNRPESADDGFWHVFSALLVNSDDFDLDNIITQFNTTALPQYWLYSHTYQINGHFQISLD